MSYFYPFLLYLGSGGSLLLLGIGSLRRFSRGQKLLAAIWMTALTLVWGLMPAAGKWMLSVWTPSNVIPGWLVFSIDPAIHWAALALGTVLSGALWSAVSERVVEPPLLGALSAMVWTVVWVGFASGSLLMTLIAWTVFDVVWFIVWLLDRPLDGQVIWALVVDGFASLLLWTVVLLLLRDGTSGLWWLVQPSRSAVRLLFFAAFMRIGFYPFHVVHISAIGRSRPLTLLGMLGPLMGVSLLYRLFSLPVEVDVPDWYLTWGTLSVIWLSLKGLSRQDENQVLPAGFALLLAGISGVLLSRNAVLLPVGVAVWFASMALLLSRRRYRREAFYLSWPAAFAVGFLLGVPPSPLWLLYGGALAGGGWVTRTLSGIGIAFAAIPLLRALSVRAKGDVRPPLPYLWVPLIGGMMMGLGVLVAATFRIGGLESAPVTWASFTLWAIALVVAATLLRFGGRIWDRLMKLWPMVELLDLQWLYRAMWRGAENILAFFRVTAEIVEGSGSVLWSVLILLLILMVVGSQ